MITLLSILVAAVLSTPQEALVSPVDLADEYAHIIVHSNKGSINRGEVPIDGYVDSEAGIVTIFFSEDCGSVAILFENSDTGYTASTLVNGLGSVAIPINCDSGYWTVTFTLSSGDVYIGNFVL